MDAGERLGYGEARGMIEWGSRQQRAAHYRRLAEEAEERADTTKFPEMRDDYLRLANRWRSLAEQTEIAKDGPPT